MPHLNESYIKQYALLHRINPSYGSSRRFANEVTSHARELRATSLLDYGCGKGELSKSLTGIPSIFCYDPAIEPFSKVPDEVVDLVTCIDVMEHIPQRDVEDVIAHIKSKGRNVFFHIHTGKAVHHLTNGENAHITIENKQWWLKKIQKFFPEANIIKTNPSSFNLRTWPSSYTKECNRLFFKARKRISNSFNSLKSR